MSSLNELTPNETENELRTIIDDGCKRCPICQDKFTSKYSKWNWCFAGIPVWSTWVKECSDCNLKVCHDCNKDNDKKCCLLRQKVQNIKTAMEKQKELLTKIRTPTWQDLYIRQNERLFQCEDLKDLDSFWFAY